MDEFIHRIAFWVEESDRIGDFPEGCWANAPVHILNRMNVPLEYGGTPLTSSALRRAVLFERIARTCPGLLIGLPGPGLSMPPVLSLGTESQKRQFFARFTEAKRPVWGAFAITEPQSGSDATTMRTIAVESDDGYTISGNKCFITNAGRADTLVVFATIAPSKGRFGIRAFMVDRDLPRFSVDRREDMLGLRASQLSTISLVDCHVKQESMLGHTGQRGPHIDAFTGAQGAWDYMRPALSASINGTCFGILDHVESLLRNDQVELTRAASACALAEIACMRAKNQSAWMLALRAAWKYDNGQSASLDASLAKAYSSTLAMDIARVINRMFPTRTLMRGDPIEKFYRDAKAFDILEGTGDMQRLMISRAFESERQQRSGG